MIAPHCRTNRRLIRRSSIKPRYRNQLNTIGAQSLKKVFNWMSPIRQDLVLVDQRKIDKNGIIRSPRFNHLFWYFREMLINCLGGYVFLVIPRNGRNIYEGRHPLFLGRSYYL